MHRVAACREAFIGGAGGVGGDDFQGLKGNVQLFRRDLLKGRLETLAEFGFAGERRDAAIGIYANPGIKKRCRCKTAWGLGRRGGRRRVLILPKRVR